MVFRRRYPGAPITRVIDGYDFEYFSPDNVPAVEESREELVFVGDMRYLPSLDAAREPADA